MPHRPFPSWLWFILQNPVRRILDPPSHLVDRLSISRTDTVLDFGCGPGFFTLELAKRARRVVALDISDKMLDRAKGRLVEGRDGYRAVAEFIQSDGRKIALPDSSVDVIFLAYVFREVNYKGEVLREMKRILRTDGSLIIVERTRLGLNILGLPLVRVSEIIEHLNSTSFKNLSNSEYQTSTMIVGRKGS